MYNKKIEANDYSYLKFIEKGTDIHLVPSLQRPYTWGDKEVKKFLIDIIENDFGYYIGSIVMVASQGSTKRDEIIDGQQRLTTLSLILIAIRKVLVNHGIKDEDSENAVLNFLLKPQHNNDGMIRLKFTNENSQSIFESLVFDKPFTAEKTDVQKKFEENLEIITEIIEENLKNNKKFLRELLDKISNLELIFITCLDRGSAYILFESINATGVSLASTDLIKNGILQRVANDSNLLEKAEQKWLELESVFDEDAALLKTFLRHDWISRGNYTSHTKIFDDFQEKFSDSSPKFVYKYLEELAESAQIYSSLRSASTEHLYGNGGRRFDVKEVKDSLEFLSFLGVDQIYSVLLFIYKNDKKNFKKELNKLVAFQFLYKFLPGSPSTIEKKFADFCAQKKDKNKLNKELVKLCKDKNSDFVEMFTEKIKYKKGKSGDVQFLLEKLAYQKDEIGTYLKPTVEHIISQNPEVRENSLVKLSNGQYKNLTDSIGNLTVVERLDNSSVDVLGNKSFSEKKEYFSKSKRASHNEILNFKFENLPKQAIENRGQQLADEIYEIFIEVLQSGNFERKVGLQNKI